MANKESIKALFISRYKNIFHLFLTIDITKNENNYILESKKFKLKIKSTNSDINDAKKEFEDVFYVVISSLIETEALFSVFSFLGIKQQTISKIMEEKKKELSTEKRDLFEYVPDALMSTSFAHMKSPVNEWAAQ